MLQRVVSSRWITTRGSVLGGDTLRRIRLWKLTLECGHVVERTVRYRPRRPEAPRANGWHPRSRHEILPAPQRARCDFD